MFLEVPHKVPSVTIATFLPNCLSLQAALNPAAPEPITITSNFSMEKIISKYGERIYSRLVNKKQGYLLNIDGDDLRTTRK